jgi:stearoyl-CoA desaturase (delta-9 desaturase)
MHVLRDYTKRVTLPVFKSEKALASGNAAFRRAKKLLVRRPTLLDERAMTMLGNLLDDNTALRTVYEYREKLSEIWTSANVSNERLLDQLKEWCSAAEKSGIRALEDFADRLRSYQMAAV